MTTPRLLTRSQRSRSRPTCLRRRRSPPMCCRRPARKYSLTTGSKSHSRGPGKGSASGRDDAYRRVLRAGKRPGRGDRAQPGAAAGLGGSAGVAARPVAAGRLGAVNEGLGTGLAVDASVTRGGFGLDVTFAVEPGQVVGVLGPNGAGKSTLLKALAGLIPVSAGRIELAGAVLDDART